GVTVGTEVLAGATTFMVMAYIIFVNPAILSFAGMPGLAGQGPGFVPTLAATCLVAGVMTALMGLVTNYPLVMASGMGLNAVVSIARSTALMAVGFRGALLVGIVLSTGVAIAVNMLTGGKAFPTPGMAVLPSHLVALPDFSTIGAGLDFSVFVRVGVITAVM